MPILILVLLAILIAQVGFWKALTAILGSVLMVVLLIVIAVALVLALAYALKRKFFDGNSFRP
ncbi:hypothetical protein [Propylenella binzhouense]|uniref:Uncharacterized protein n=1 Tax=Propylenella binzhouense TaxID=2555902 RepID=A0A964WV98_9HYPH|nr:hypothetical protein [Propylenella binzhouense]MYZ50002.1 hypothetical protein [Propylenella binzhouense]